MVIRPVVSAFIKTPRTSISRHSIFMRIWREACLSCASVSSFPGSVLLFSALVELIFAPSVLFAASVWLYWILWDPLCISKWHYAGLVMLSLDQVNFCSESANMHYCFCQTFSDPLRLSLNSVRSPRIDVQLFQFVPSLRNPPAGRQARRVTFRSNCTLWSF